MYRMDRLLQAVWASLLSVTAGSEFAVTATYGGHAVLPCHCGHRSASRVYWQIQRAGGPEVVKVFCAQPQPKCKTSGSNYEKRSDFTGPVHRGNFSLTIRDVTLEDQRPYICVVQGQDVQQCIVRLTIVAQYSQPNITGPSQGSVAPGREVNLTCSSRGGFPEARVRWINGTSNSSISDGLVVTRHDAGQSGGGTYRLYDVVSTLRVNATRDPIRCQIVNSHTEEVSTSAPLQVIGVDNGTSGHSTSTGCLTAITAPSLLCLALTTLYLVYD